MLKTGLHLRTSQHLALTPQLQQSIRLLQMSTQELEGEIEQALRDNPLLEADESGPRTEALVSMRSERRRADADLDDDSTRQIAQLTSLQAHLTTQVRMTRASPRDMALVGALIVELDDNGYLCTPLEEIAELLPPSLEVDLSELRAALGLLQSLEPEGVGARDLAECLGLQLRQPSRQLLASVAAGPKALACARQLCAGGHLPLMAARDYARLQRVLDCDEATLRVAQALVRRLDPLPGARYGVPTAAYVIPDVVVRRWGGRWRAEANPDALPRLRVNPEYARIVRDERASLLGEQLREARSLLRNVQQRGETIARVAQAIVERQQGFFEHGAIAMRPLVLREIAEALELHESTISRVTTQKYLQAPCGVFEFKHFFGSQVSTQEGGGTSSTAVQEMIRQLVAAENPAKPLSDSAIANTLETHGMVVARRTVAKYRDILKIAPAAQRKVL